MKGDGQLVTKTGNEEQMRGMVPGLGSVSGCPQPTPRQRRYGVYGHVCDRCVVFGFVTRWKEGFVQESSVAAASETSRQSVSGRKSMGMLVDENGEKRQMNENEKIREYFLNAKSRLPEDRPHDKVEFKSNVETMIAANDAFQQAVVATGANEGSLLVNVEPLTSNELTKLVTLVESMVGDKYKSQDEWGTMSDANRFLSGVMAKTTVNRPVLARALRMETVPEIIDIFTTMYTDVVQAVPQDGKKLDRVQKILTSRNQDQQTLAAALKDLLAKHCTMLDSRLENKEKDKVALSDNQ
jgi:hypothetical protein